MGSYIPSTHTDSNIANVCGRHSLSHAHSFELLSIMLAVMCCYIQRQVKFVDLSKLPKKYKQSYSLDALRQQRQQQQQKAIELEQQQEQQEQQEREQQQQQLEQGKVPQRWWQKQNKRQQLVRSLPAQVLDKLPPGGRVVKVEMGTPEAAAAAAAGAAAGSDWADGSSSSSRVQPLYDLDSNSISSSRSGGSGGDWADDILGASGIASDSSSSRGGGDTFQSPGAGRYEAEFVDLPASSSSSEAAAGGEGDFGPGSQQQQQQQQGQGEGSEGEEEEAAADPDFILDESKLQQLVDSARSEGLDVSRALAEAVAFGVQIDATAAAAVGVELPPPDAVEAAREGIVAAIREMQDQDQESSAAAAAAAAAAATAAAEGGQDAEEVQVGSSSSAGRGGRSRAWGTGLTAAVQRAKAVRSSSGSS
jgi:hypothetical protein